MNLYIFIEIISIFSLIMFSLLCFTKIENKWDINKTAYLFSLIFLGVVSLLHYLFILSLSPSKLTLVTSLLIVITFFVFFLLSFFSNQFIRLRILFIPFFFSILIFRSFIGITFGDNLTNYQLFNNKFLVIHIITSLLSYSLITISLVTSFCIYVQDLYIKKMKYNKIINNFLPSIYESELLAVRFLYATIIFLIVSLISGLYYYIESGQNLIYFLSEKVILSIITLILTFIIILVRIIRGISGLMIFRMILLSYLFINFSYFGIRLIQ